MDPKYVLAFDPIVKKTVVHVISPKGWVISMVTGHKFKSK